MIKRKQRFFKLIVAILLLLLPVEVISNVQKTKNYYLHHAQTYYWLGIQDKGDPRAFRTALEFLKLAKVELESSVRDIDPSEKESLIKQIKLLELDLKEQLAIAQNTFIGRFPLAVFMGESLFISSRALGSFEILEDAGEVAITRSANKLGGLFYNHFFGELQLPLVVFSKDNSFPELESKVRLVLKSSPRVKVYQNQYLGKYFSEFELNQLQKGTPDSLLVGKVSKILKAENFAITTIKKVDHVNDVFFYSLSTRVFSGNSEIPLQSIVLYELVRDKRQSFFLYLITILIMFIASSFVHVIIYKYHTGNYPKFGKISGITALSFFTGFFSSIIILGVLSNIQPDYLDYFAYTFWWIPAAMFSIFIAPIFILKKYILTLSFFQSAEDSSSRLSPIFLSASLGVLAYLTLGLILYHESMGLLYAFAAAFSIGIPAFIIGKVLGTIKPLAPVFGIIAVLIIAVAGLALASHSIYYMVVPVLASSSLLLASHLKNIKSLDLTETKSLDSKKSINIKQLVDLTENPPYIKTNSYYSAWKKVDLFARDFPKIICLTGDEGTGKTAMAEHLITELYAINSEQSNCILLLDARCSINNDSPYLPVQNALTEFINFKETDSFGNQSMEEIEDALDKLVGSFVPFSNLLKSANKTRNAGINNQSELFYFITKTLYKLSKEYQLVFFIDDLHWADSATLDLLNHVHQHFRNLSSNKTLFLYTARPSDTISSLFLEHEIHPLDVLSYNEKFTLLTEQMGIDQETASFLLECLGVKKSKDNLFLLYKIIEQLAREGHFKEQLNGISLSKDILQSGKLPIPDDYLETLRHELNKYDHYEEYIAIAACMGMDFEVDNLSQALEVDRLKCLKVLQYLENETSILHDIPDKDDVFSFSSSFTHETIKQIFSLTDEGPNDLVKQIVREYHARIATTLEEKDTEKNVLRIASHYYAAGQNYAEKGLLFLIKAANRCADIFRFDEARIFLRKAAIEKNYSRNSSNYELELLLVECKISMLEGKDFEVTAHKCSQYLLRNPVTTDLDKLVFARAFYNARRFDETVMLAKEIIKICDNEYVLARAYHLLGISLSLDLSDERLSNLNKALETLENLPEKNIDQLKAIGEIHNSLGEEITKIAQKEPSKKELAVKHFEESLKIKQLNEISDTPGLARTYGGLGRLEMYIQPVNIKKALDFFKKDLELSEQIGDLLGQTQMHSNIGKCYILLGQFEKAGLAYERSLDLAERPVDKIFALFGQLNVNDQSYSYGSRKKIVDELINIISEDGFIMPLFLENEIIRFIQTAGNKKSLDKLQKLLELK